MMVATSSFVRAPWNPQRALIPKELEEIEAANIPPTPDDQVPDKIKDTPVIDWEEP